MAKGKGGKGKGSKGKKSAAFPHGKSIKNPATYEALKGSFSKSSAAAISNAALNKGYKKGVHRGKGK